MALIIINNIAHTVYINTHVWRSYIHYIVISIKTTCVCVCVCMITIMYKYYTCSNVIAPYCNIIIYNIMARFVFHVCFFVLPQISFRVYRVGVAFTHDIFCSHCSVISGITLEEDTHSFYEEFNVQAGNFLKVRISSVFSSASGYCFYLLLQTSIAKTARLFQNLFL